MRLLCAVMVCVGGLLGCRGPDGLVEKEDPDSTPVPEPTGGTGDSSEPTGTPTGTGTGTGTIEDTGTLVERRVVLSTALDGDFAGNATILRAHGGMWILWENATTNMTRSLLKLLHTDEDPLDGSWTETEVRRTAVQIKPSLFESPDGAFLLTNECVEGCTPINWSQGQLDFHPASEPAVSSSTWPLPNDPAFDIGRGDVAVGPDGPVVCFSVKDASLDLEWIRCDVLREGAWVELQEVRSDDNADHPCTLLDDEGRLVVGFDGKVEGRREAKIAFPDGEQLRLAAGQAGGDVQLVLEEGRLHAAFRARIAPGEWTARHGVCDSYPDCQTIDQWVVTDLGDGVDMEGVGLAADERHVVVVWTQVGDGEATDVYMSWVGSEGTSRFATEASTNQGQPSLVLDDNALWLAFTSEPEDAPPELHLARLPRPD